MNDLTAVLQSAGVPSLVISLLVGGFYIVEKLKLFHRPPKRSDRELLSEDEQKFRADLRAEVAELRAECRRIKAEADVAMAKMRLELVTCEERHDELAATLTRFIQAAREGHLDALMEESELLPPAKLSDLSLDPEI